VGSHRDMRDFMVRACSLDVPVEARSALLVPVSPLTRFSIFILATTNSVQTVFQSQELAQDAFHVRHCERQAQGQGSQVGSNRARRGGRGVSSQVALLSELSRC